MTEIKPFKLKKKWIEAIKNSKYGALMTDNDYNDGILRILAHKVNEKTHKKIYVMGLDDKSAGHHLKVDNLPPSAQKIKRKILEIIK